MEKIEKREPTTTEGYFLDVLDGIQDIEELGNKTGIATTECAMILEHRDELKKETNWGENQRLN